SEGEHGAFQGPSEDLLVLLVTRPRRTIVSDEPIRRLLRTNSRAFRSARPAANDHDGLDRGMSLYELHARPDEITTRGRLLIMVANVQQRITSTPCQQNAFLSSVMRGRLDRRHH